jgi:hypothetical protein
LTIITPAYFSKEFPLREWETFEIRSKLTKTNLIIPIIFRGAQSTPDWFRNNYQYLDLENLFISGKQYNESREYRIKIKDLTDRIRILLEQAPPFDPNWPVASYQDVQKLLYSPKPKLPRSKP